MVLVPSIILRSVHLTEFYHALYFRDVYPVLFAALLDRPRKKYSLLF
jgi:hypothetical protein